MGEVFVCFVCVIMSHTLLLRKSMFVVCVCVCPCSKTFVGTCMYSCSFSFPF